MILRIPTITTLYVKSPNNHALISVRSNFCTDSASGLAPYSNIFFFEFGVYPLALWQTIHTLIRLQMVPLEQTDRNDNLHKHAHSNTAEFTIVSHSVLM